MAGQNHPDCGQIRMTRRHPIGVGEPSAPVTLTFAESMGICQAVGTGDAEQGLRHTGQSLRMSEERLRFRCRVLIERLIRHDGHRTAHGSAGLEVFLDPQVVFKSKEAAALWTYDTVE